MCDQTFVGEFFIGLFGSVCRGNVRVLFHFLLKSPGRGVEQPGPDSGRKSERRNEKHRGEKLKKDRPRISPKKRLRVNSKIRRVLKVRIKMPWMMKRKARLNPRKARASEKRFVSFVVLCCLGYESIFSFCGASKHFHAFSFWSFTCLFLYRSSLLSSFYVGVFAPLSVLPPPLRPTFPFGLGCLSLPPSLCPSLPPFVLQ